MINNYYFYDQSLLLLGLFENEEGDRLVLELIRVIMEGTLLGKIVWLHFFCPEGKSSKNCPKKKKKKF